MVDAGFCAVVLFIIVVVVELLRTLTRKPPAPKFGANAPDPGKKPILTSGPPGVTDCECEMPRIFEALEVRAPAAACPCRGATAAGTSGAVQY